MSKIIKITFSLVLLSGVLLAQFKSDIQRIDFPQELSNMNALESRSLFDPSRFQMNHNFSMSMMSMGGMSMGVGAYTNFMSFALRENLHLTTNFSLVKPSVMQAANSQNLLEGQVYYGAHLEYRPNDNTVLQLGFQTAPGYLNYFRPMNIASGNR